MAIPLYDDFANAVGQFPNYDTYDSGQRTQLARQKHVDLRSFVPGPGTSFTMFSLDPDTILTMDTLSMTALESGQPFGPNEAWTAGTLGPITGYNGFTGLSLSCTTGANATQSVMTAISLAAFTNSDFISLALPSFPLSSLTPASTFIDFTSEPTGSFSTGPTDSIAFSTSITTLTTGDCEARFPLSALATVDRHAITGVRLRVQATASCTLRCLAIRCLASTWAFAPVDQNTLYGRLQATVPPNASMAQASAFPTAGAPVTPADWPVLFFSDAASGPLAVDTEIGAVIQTGANSAQNTFTFYFRELPMVPNTVGGLDGASMTALETIGDQLDYAPGVLDDFTHSRYLTASIQWGTSSAVHIKDQSGIGYDFTGFTLSPNTQYYAVAKLEDTSLRVRIYNVNTTGVIDLSTVVFDSTAVVDSAFIPRRRGRVGWYAQLKEGDTFVERLRPRRIVYGEYRSAPLASMTPVDGARLYTSASPDVQLYDGAVATTGAIISLDVTKSRSGRCIRVQCDGQHPLEGLFTAPVRFENFYDSVIEFDLLIPSTVNLAVLLRGENRLISLYLPPLPTNQWAHVTIPLTTIAATTMPGPYSFLLIQADATQNIWFVDNPEIRTRSVTWEGRGHAGDPLKVINPSWIPFGDAINDPHNAALLGRGNSLQVRGQAVTQDATITGVTILPKYAELGHFIWADEAPSYPTAPTASFTTSATGLAVAANGSASTASGGVLAYAWNFGDGLNGYGVAPVHTYAAHGTYTITLTVVDADGQKVSVTHSVTV